MKAIFVVLALTSGLDAAVRFGFGQEVSQLGNKREALDEVLSLQAPEWTGGPRSWARKDGKFIFLDGMKGRLAIFDSTGNFSGAVTLPATVSGKQVDPAVMVSAASQYYVWDDAGQRLLSVSDSGTREVSVQGTGTVILEQLVLADSSLMMVDTFAGRVLRLNPSEDGSMQAEALLQDSADMPYCAADGTWVIASQTGTGKLKLTRHSDGKTKDIMVQAEGEGTQIRVLFANAQKVVVGLLPETSGRALEDSIQVYDWEGKLLKSEKTPQPLPTWDFRPAAIEESGKLFIPLFVESEPQALEIFELSL